MPDVTGLKAAQILSLLHDRIFDGGAMLKKAFLKVESVQDGRHVVSADGVKAVMREFGFVLSPEQLEELYSSLDRDKSGHVEWWEFISTVQGCEYSNAPACQTEASKDKDDDEDKDEEPAPVDSGMAKLSLYEQALARSGSSNAPFKVMRRKRRVLLPDALTIEEALLRIRNHLWLGNYRGVEEKFSKIDINSDGSLSQAEFLDGLVELGFKLGPEMARRLFTAFDENGDGSVQYHEFLSALQSGVFASTADDADAMEAEQPDSKAPAKPEAEKPSGRTDGILSTRRSSMNTKDKDKDKDDSKVAKKPKHSDSMQRLVAKQRKIKISDNVSVGDVMTTIHDHIYDNGTGLNLRFKRADSNHDGCLDFDEFRAALEGWGLELAPALFKKVFDRFDKNHDGKIDYREFLLTVRHRDPNRGRDAKSPTRRSSVKIGKDGKPEERPSSGKAAPAKPQPAMKISVEATEDRKEEQQGLTRTFSGFVQVSLPDELTNEEALLRLRNSFAFGNMEVYDKKREHLAVGARHLGSLQEAFKTFDKEHKGQVSLQAFSDTLKSLGFVVSAGMTKRLFTAFDRNSDGRINYGEFVGVIKDANFIPRD